MRSTLRPATAAPRRRRFRQVALMGSVGAGGTLAATLLFVDVGEVAVAPAAMSVIGAHTAPVPVGEEAATSPSTPPPRPSEDQLIADLARDAWIHPLAGPVRRMPLRDSRVFGAERPGDRPPECGSGHCGVDIGGDTWGEPVLAVHDGVVDRVQRGPNTEHGGQYVRLAHREGAIFTQYFHLAAIPTWLRTGDAVKLGDVIGLLGDTGVKNSGPHLHFTLSVYPDQGLPEQFIDPETLIALWPLKIKAGPGESRTIALASPGMVRGPASSHRRGKRRRGRESIKVAYQPAAEPMDVEPAVQPEPSADLAGGATAAPP